MLPKTRISLPLTLPLFFDTPTLMMNLLPLSIFVFSNGILFLLKHFPEGQARHPLGKQPLWYQQASELRNAAQFF